MHNGSENRQPVAGYSRRRALWSGLLGGLAWAGAWCSSRVARSQSRAAALPRHITPEAELAIERGLRWLTAGQQADGGFGARDSYARNVGVCALCGVAFLAHRGPRGPFAGAISGCTDYLLGRTQSNGFIVEQDVKTHGPMYGHGFATMYLGQVYGADRRSELRYALKQAVNLIVDAQDKNGSWRYTSSPDDGDVSVSTCQLMALYSARHAGIAVPKLAIERGLGFLLRCQNVDGGFRYRLIDPPESLFPRSAAALATLVAFGFHDDDPAIVRARAYLAAPTSTPAPDKAEYYYYGRYYAAHAAWQAGEAAWNRWYPAARDELLSRQTAAGNWEDPNIGDEYATAMALIVLEYPFDNVPMFAR